MVISNLVVSRPLARKLAKAGFPAKTLFRHIKLDDPKKPNKYYWEIIFDSPYPENLLIESIPAPTSAEIEALFPHELTVTTGRSLYGSIYCQWKYNGSFYNYLAKKNEANARAAIWLEMRKEGLL